MPVTGPEALPDRQTPLLASGGESVRVSAVLLGAYKFPTTDSRDDVGFLGSLPLSPRTKSKPVTPKLCTRTTLTCPGRRFTPVSVQLAPRAVDRTSGGLDLVPDLLACLEAEAEGGARRQRSAGQHVGAVRAFEVGVPGVADADVGPRVVGQGHGPVPGGLAGVRHP